MTLILLPIQDDNVLISTGVEGIKPAQKTESMQCVARTVFTLYFISYNMVTAGLLNVTTGCDVLRRKGSIV